MESSGHENEELWPRNALLYFLGQSQTQKYVNIQLLSPHQALKCVGTAKMVMYFYLDMLSTKYSAASFCGSRQRFSHHSGITQ